ncbi:YIP1 family protein [Mechercharimyces sp. CAU 1602]|uniref:YIP1 family protein n=1 Tax=Mechercharimyces sp. CAU 1602 TaxID=2973933 RepID=UPI0021621C7E|nr:YIP1 family protein [Mechercharimyces sp. CAU 1602]MCS1352468.1 YIP1 family protein [Mechercharimyces sp. CAU 1602]
METETMQTEKKPSILGMIMSPGEQFARIKENPRFWGALITVTLLNTLLITLSMFLIVGTPEGQEEMMSQVNGQEVSDAMLEGMKWMMVGVGALGMLFVYPIVILLTTLLHWFLMRMVNSDITYRQTLSVNSYAMVISLLGSTLLVVTIATGIYQPLLDEISTYPTSLASMVETESAVVGALLSTIEIFTIWQLILTAMGLSIVGSVSRGKGWTVALVVFSLGVLLNVVGAMIGMA